MKISAYDSLEHILKELGTRAQNYRVKMNMTQKDLAMRSGVSLRTISAIESGKNSSLENMIRILKTLDLEHSIDSIVPDDTQISIKKEMPTRKRYKPSTAKTTKWTWDE